MSQVTPVINSGQCSFAHHKLQPVRRASNHVACTSSSNAWSTPNLSAPYAPLSSCLIAPRQPVFHTFQSSSGNICNQYVDSNNRSMVLTSSKLPQKRSESSSRIPGPGCSPRVASLATSNTLGAKINSTPHNGPSSQSSLAMVARESARRSTSPQVSSVKATPAPVHPSNGVSSKTMHASATGNNQLNTNCHESRSRRTLTNDKNSCNGGSGKLAIRPPRPTSIPSVSGDVKCSTASNVNGKNCINSKYLVNAKTSKNVTGNNSCSSARAPQQVHQQQQCAPLKEFMANRRIVESTASSPADHCTSKIATIAPCTKVFTSVTFSNGPPPPPPPPPKLSISPSLLSPLSPNTDKQNISTNEITKAIASLDHLAKSPPTLSPQTSRQSTPSLAPAPPVTPRRASIVNSRDSETLGQQEKRSVNSLVTQRLDAPLDQVSQSTKSCSVGAKRALLENHYASSDITANDKCSSLNDASPLSLSSGSTCSLSPSSSDTQSQWKVSEGNRSNCLSTFTITSSVTSTSPSPPVIAVDENTCKSKLTPLHIAPPANSESGKEDQVKCINGPESGGGGFHRINAVTCKPSQSGELDEASTRPLFSFISSGKSPPATTAPVTNGQHQLSSVTNTPHHSQGKSIHVYPFIRGETASSTLAQLPMSSLVHSLSTRRLDKIASVAGQDALTVNNDPHAASDCVPAMSLARSSFNLTGNSGCSASSPVSFASIAADASGRANDIESLGVKFPSMRNLVTPPPTPFGASVGGSSNHLRRLSKNSDLRGSAASLLSGSSNFSSAEEKQVSEIKRLKSELNRANEKVATLSTQLVTSSQMLSAFDQSLSSMANRMHQINLACEHKDRTIDKLSRTIEELRRKKESAPQEEEDGEGARRESCESAAVRGRGRGKRESLSSTLPQWSRKSGSCDQLNGKKVRMRSCSRDNSGSTVSPLADSSAGGWIRQSISRAFRKSRTRSKSGNESGSDGESLGSRSNLSSVTDANGCAKASASSFSPSTSSSPSCNAHQQSPRVPEKDESPSSDKSTTVTKQLDDVTELKLDVEKKERALTDLRLESLSMAHQMESMKESMVKMKSQIDDLLSDNLRLQLLLSACKVDRNSFNGNSSTFPTSPVTSCDQLYSHNGTDPLMIALKRLQDATVE